MPEGRRMHVGLTLPTFVEDPEVLVRVARRAEAAGLSGVFTYDHLFRIGSDGTAPSLSLEPVLGALAVETERMHFGSLVARAGLRHPRVLASVFETVARVAPGRLIAALGTGDRQSDPEQEMFGLPTGPRRVRLGALEATVEAVRGHGFPVWVGGRSDVILGTVGGLADGWNGWGLSVGSFRWEVERIREASAAAGRAPDAITATWAGLVELRPDRWAQARERPDVLAGPWDQMAETLSHLADAGAAWVILAPLAPGDADNADVVAEELLPRL